MDRDYRLSIAVAALVLSSAGCSGDKVAEKSAAVRKPVPKITQFYTSPDRIAPGETVLICYGVENAEQVQMDPPLENVRPVLSRCLPAKPIATTTYTVTAISAEGRSSASATVVVDRNAKRNATAQGEKPSSLSFFADHKSVKAGQPVVLCYQAGTASKVDVQPRSASVSLPATGCITEQPVKTTKYVLSAEFSDGRHEKQEVEVRVE